MRQARERTDKNRGHRYRQPGSHGRPPFSPSSKLAKHRAEDPRRVAILSPGLLIIASVLTHYGLDRVTVVPEGLSEGMILAVAKLGDDWWRDS